MFLTGMNAIPLPDQVLEFEQVIGGITFHGTLTLTFMQYNYLRCCNTAILHTLTLTTHRSSSFVQWDPPPLGHIA